MKRFRDQATAEPVGEGYAILPAGRPARIPGGATLHLAHVSLARAIAAECWLVAGRGKEGDVPR